MKAALSAEQDALLARTCPGLGLDASALRGPHYHPIWGPVRAVWTGFARDDELRFRGSSGGVVSALVQHLLSSGKAAFAVQVKSDPSDPFLSVAVWSESRGDVLESAGSRYCPSSPLANLAAALARNEPFVFVGKPCDVAAVLSYAKSEPRLQRHLVCTIAFMCAGVPARTGSEQVVRQLGLTPESVATFRYRGNGWPGHATATTHDGLSRSMDYRTSWGTILNRHLPYRCKLCIDSTGEFADVTCADAWYGDDKGYPDFEERPGRSIVIGRTELGVSLIERAVRAHAISIEATDLESVARMQPYQAKRRRTMGGRIAGTAVTGSPTPHYRGFPKVNVFARGQFRDTVTAFAGAARRGVELKLLKVAKALRRPPASGNTECFRVGLLWHSFRSGNLGVGALSLANVAVIERAAAASGMRVSYVMFGWPGGERDYTPTGLDVQHVQLPNLREVLRAESPFVEAVRRCDLVVDIGEGDSFTDMYGQGRFWNQAKTKALVLWLGVPLVLAPQTIGPFQNRKNRILAKALLRGASAVFTRDQLSIAELGSVGKAAVCATDLALRLDYERPTRTKSGAVRVGLNVSGLLYNGGYTKNDPFGLTLDYPTLVQRLVEYWLDQPGVELWLVAHVLSPLRAEDDRLANAQLLQRYPKLHVAPEFRDPREAKSFIADLDFFSGARMHACIAALSAGVPVVPLAYSRKFKGLLDALDYPWLADGRELSTDQAFSYIVHAFEQRTQLVDALDRVQSTTDMLLGRYESYIAQLLGSRQRATPGQRSGLSRALESSDAERRSAAEPRARTVAG
jgi:coenzyme F420-reducing hydrogenase beta subunit/polysaccharide pyruvyl transferase WcaK-like protein